MDQSLGVGVLRRERAEKSARFVNDPLNAKFTKMLLPQDVHEWCAQLIRRPEKRFSHRREWTFASVESAICYVEDAIASEMKCIVLGYNIDNEVSLIMPKTDAFSFLKERNTALSMDGVIIADVNITSSFILDYDDADEFRSLSRVFCSVIGEVALNPRFPGLDEGRFIN